MHARILVEGCLDEVISGNLLADGREVVIEAEASPQDRFGIDCRLPLQAVADLSHPDNCRLAGRARGRPVPGVAAVRTRAVGVAVLAPPEIRLAALECRLEIEPVGGELAPLHRLRPGSVSLSVCRKPGYRNAGDNYGDSRCRSRGKRTASRMLSSPSIVITSRSAPSPQPAWGGIP